MIDLHSHLLPGIDDGATDLAVSVEMARRAVADGVTVMACTPHIQAGLYDNSTPVIAGAVERLQAELDRQGIGLQLLVGADIHIAPDLPEQLSSGWFPTLNGTRYFLFEPPHHVVPPKLQELAERVLAAGFVPILTHPERLTWTENHYEVVERLNAAGCLIQLTAGSITGVFGRGAKQICERMLDEGRVDIIASDAHNLAGRAPGLSKAAEIVARRLDEAEADRMVRLSPLAIMKNETVRPVFRNGASLRKPASARKRSATQTEAPASLMQRLFRPRSR